jgi:hypothetical protein
MIQASEGGMGAMAPFQRGVPHTVATTVAQGQWRVRPPVARYARAVEVPHADGSRVPHPAWKDG